MRHPVDGLAAVSFRGERRGAIRRIAYDVSGGGSRFMRRQAPPHPDRAMRRTARNRGPARVAPRRRRVASQGALSTRVASGGMTSLSEGPPPVPASVVTSPPLPRLAPP